MPTSDKLGLVLRLSEFQARLVNRRVAWFVLDFGLARFVERKSDTMNSPTPPRKPCSSVYDMRLTRTSGLVNCAPCSGE
jgi:hypothetical protein